jgi:hypothetical protein
MSGSTFSVAAKQTTDTEFRAWGSAISAGLAAAGCVQTADTGQINWSTVVKPASAGVMAGYEIWRFNDSLQATAPVFFKIEYGASAAAAANPDVWVTVGTGSNGSGTITGTALAGVAGALTTRREFLSAAQSTPATTSACYVYGDTSSVAVVLWPSLGAAWAGGFFVIERWRAWDGTASGDGVTLFGGYSDTSATNVTVSMLCYLPGMAPNPSGPGALVVAAGGFSNWATCNIGGTVYGWPVTHGVSPRASAPSKYLLACLMGDYPVGTVTLTHYGVSRSFVSLGPGSSSGIGVGWANLNINGTSKASYLVGID